MSTMTMSPSAPTSMSAATSSFYYPSISRSDELLSCAKTVVKMAQRQHANNTQSMQDAASDSSAWWSHYNPTHMHLHQVEHSAPTSSILEDCLALLRTMEGELKQLELLVRRRGHTNDPTEEITRAVQRLEADAKQVSQLMRTMVPPTARGQCRKHWEVLQQWFQSVAQKQSERLKEILKVRSKVLEEQQQRRKRFQASSSSNSSTKAAYQDNPLFQIQKVKPPANGALNTAATNGQVSAATSKAVQAPSTGQNGSNVTKLPRQNTNHQPPLTAGGYYAASSSSNNATSLYNSASAAGYGGAAAASTTYYSAGSHTTGMRQRRVTPSFSHHDNHQQHNQQDAQTQFLIQQQQEERATQQRLQEARHAERSLAELGTLFGKMSSLISQQSEVLENIEDDVEAACIDVAAGHAEITTLYSIKRGNRALILKVFGLLIFFIIFMRLYAKK
ncbi:hypothetical protein MPSEU_000184900 [Mayamaea pseudoterrestris]|nr:hypothetical protein MPSEU_000184900 [Mayamaea pseudoterrestris]